MDSDTPAVTTGRSLKSRLMALVSWITVEPVEFLYCLMFTTSYVVRDNLFILKVCRLDFDYTMEVCLNYTEDGEAEDDVIENIQDRVAELEMWDGILVAIPSAFFCLFVGNWSDYHGRKLLLVLPFIGNIASYLVYMLNYWLFYEMNTNWLLMASVLYGLTGAYQCLNMGLYGYVSDVTTREDRTMRLSLLNGVFSMAYVIGNTMGSRIYEANPNYYLIFGISVGIGLMAIVYSLLLKESVHSTKEQKKQHKLLDIDNAKQCMYTAVKPRPGRGRLHVLLLITNFALFMFPLNTSHYDYLLTQLRYDWTIVEYSDYLSFQRICRMLGLFLLLPFLSKVLRVDDALTATVCTLLTAGAYLLIGVGSEDWTGPDGTWSAGWIMFLSAVFQFNSVITVIIRSQCTKSVGEAEIGRVFAAVAFIQCLVPLAAYPVYGLVYQATLSSFPGAYLVIVSALLFVAFLISIFLTVESKKGRLGLKMDDCLDQQQQRNSETESEQEKIESGEEEIKC